MVVVVAASAAAAAAVDASSRCIVLCETDIKVGTAHLGSGISSDKCVMVSSGCDAASKVS